MSKGLDALQFMRERDMFIHSCANTIEKELKALEVIKKKGVLVNGLIKSKYLGEYNTLCNYYQMSELLTQEQYDLLKEVLL